MFLLKAWLNNCHSSCIEKNSFLVSSYKRRKWMEWFWTTFTFLSLHKDGKNRRCPIFRVSWKHARKMVSGYNSKLTAGNFRVCSYLYFPFLFNQNGEMNEWEHANLMTLQKHALIVHGLLKRTRALKGIWDNRLRTAVLKGIVILAQNTFIMPPSKHVQPETSILGLVWN